MNNLHTPNSPHGQGGNTELPAKITREGSKQTYYTFLLLADRERRQDAYRAYAYFRWLDDLLDCRDGTKEQKIAIITQQKQILEDGYQGKVPTTVSPEEQMLVELIAHDSQEQSGMQIYLRNMMAVMAFDVERCGRAVTQAELSEYTRLLSTAVTELMYYLISQKDAPKEMRYRYDAVCGAHIVHMLRDMGEDIAVGYINIPAEYVQHQRITMEDMQSLSFRKWVYGRVQLARTYFNHGRKYIAQAKNMRIRLAGFAYIARFEWMLKTIERDGYCLRAEYPERKSLRAGLWMMWRVALSGLKLPWIRLGLGKQRPLTGRCEEG